MIEDKTRKRLPPYISYKTFSNFLDELGSQGIPSHIDRKFWGDHYSGSTGNQLVAALRFLSLIDTNSVPTDRLRKLANFKGPGRAEHLKAVTVESFSFLSGVNLQTDSYNQLEEAFHKCYPLTGAVSRKCIKFYVAIAKESGITLSNRITARIRNNNGTGIGIKGITRRKNSRTDLVEKIPQRMEFVPNAENWDKMLLSKFPDLDHGWSEELKICWFKDFDILMRILLRIRPVNDGA